MFAPPVSSVLPYIESPFVFVKGKLLHLHIGNINILPGGNHSKHFINQFPLSLYFRSNSTVRQIFHSTRKSQLNCCVISPISETYALHITVKQYSEPLFFHKHTPFKVITTIIITNYNILLLPCQGMYCNSQDFML